MKNLTLASVVVFLGLVVLLSGCKTWFVELVDSLKDDVVPAVVTNATTTVTNAPVVETPVNTGAVQEPIIGDHGEPRWADNQAGDSWRQYPDGYFDDGNVSDFIWNINNTSRKGIAYVLEQAGGRNFGNARITNVKCIKRSTFKCGDWADCPDKADWIVTIDGGFEVCFSWSHLGDVMPRATVKDTQRGVQADFPCNGHPCGGSNDWCHSGRGYDFVMVNGERCATGIRMVHPDVRRR